MPPVALGNSTFSGVAERNQSLKSKNIEYRYPMGLDLRPGHSIHDNIVSKVMMLAQDSYKIMQKRHPSWNEIDQTLTAYIPLSEYEKSLKSSDKTKPVSVVIPFSYAALETVLAYDVKAFLSGPTIFQYEGFGPEDTVPAKLLELCVSQQVRHFKSVLDIHTAFRDGLGYGLGVSTVVWTEKWGRKPVMQQFPRYSSMGTYLGTSAEKKNVAALLFEGNKVVSIDPYRALLDPNVSIHKVQDGRFFGWFDLVSVEELISEENNNGQYFNVKYVKESMGNTSFSSIFNINSSKRDLDGVQKGQTLTRDTVPLYIYINIIPNEWGLPGNPEFNRNGDTPEIWSFTIANDNILIDIGPLDLNHQMYPVAVNSPDFDGYSVLPISRMEMNRGLQTVLNFSFNSHMTNVRKALHDMFIVDPSLISMKDLESPEPGKFIRLRRTAWGRGVEHAVQQLAVTDITKGNMGDAGFIMDMMQRSFATSDAGMGTQRRGGPDRVTAAEFTGTYGSQISRLERLSVMTSLQYMHDLGYFYGSHTQQLMSQDMYVRAIGDWPQVLIEEYGGMTPERISVDPFAILADYDVVVKDNSEASSDQGVMQFWQQALPAILGKPELFSIFNIPSIFKHIARISGEKNVGNFILAGGGAQAQVVGQAALQKMIQEGNVAPVSEVPTPSSTNVTTGSHQISLNLAMDKKGGVTKRQIEHIQTDANGNIVSMKTSDSDED